MSTHGYAGMWVCRWLGTLVQKQTRELISDPSAWHEDNKALNCYDNADLARKFNKDVNLSKGTFSVFEQKTVLESVRVGELVRGLWVCRWIVHSCHQMCVCACARACVCACVRARSRVCAYMCVCVCVRARARACVCVHARAPACARLCVCLSLTAGFSPRPTADCRFHEL